MRIIITGSSGYIGTCCYEYLKNKFEVYGIDKIRPFLLKQKKFFLCNLNNYIKLNFIISNIRPDLIIHLAGQSTIDGIKNKRSYEINNFNATRKLIKICQKEKVKYFNPAFHSMTPEGLNSRLTFLNQCVRPGETIPVIGPDGTPKYNDAVNTSFGAPPVLILRIGDFFHTKIIPGSLQIGYEPLIFDLNPEGIGVQPMIANISLSFNVIGGQGIAKPVEQLQNALSFNYYGNTEVYDDRAVFTEDTSALDKTLVQGVLDGEQPVTPAQVDNQQPNDGGSTIGTIITNIPVASGQTGEIGYKEIMDKLYDGTKDYFTTIVNQLEKVVLINNYGVLMMLNDRRENNPESTDLPTKNGSDDEKVLIYGNP
jgi:hypothetical protein